ncbi:MAG: CRISPR-associated protein Cas4 [Candidatus Bilamarchaeaceae archaeon]
MEINGTEVNYYFSCPTKLWYFRHRLQMEQTSDLVAIGRIIHETAYKNERKNIRTEHIAIDFIHKDNVVEIHEIKKSPRIEKAHEMQALYYLYFLKKRGIVKTKAIIDYPLLRERKELILTKEKELEIENALNKIKEIISLPTPPEPKRIPRCRKCAYFELCWSD